MELKKLIRNVDGNLEATWILTQDQMAVLYWYAINDLVSRGLAKVVEISDEDLEQMKKEVVQEKMEAVLVASDPKDLPQT